MSRVKEDAYGVYVRKDGASSITLLMVGMMQSPARLFTMRTMPGTILQGDNMNAGTKIRTALRIAVSLNTAIYAVSASVVGLGFHKLTTLWTIITIASDLVVAAITTYYNNDYTQIASKHTGRMRLEKEQNAGIIHGEDFTDEPEEDEEEDGDGLDPDEADADDIDDGPNDADPDDEEVL